MQRGNLSVLILVCAGNPNVAKVIHVIKPPLGCKLPKNSAPGRFGSAGEVLVSRTGAVAGEIYFYRYNRKRTAEPGKAAAHLAGCLFSASLIVTKI